MNRSRWTIETRDRSNGALRTAGAFGIYAQHAADGRGSVVRVADVIARSHERGATTPPEITYSLAGVPYDNGKKVKVVAKVAVPGSRVLRIWSRPHTHRRRGEGARRTRQCEIADRQERARPDAPRRPKHRLLEGILREKGHARSRARYRASNLDAPRGFPFVSLSARALSGPRSPTRRSSTLGYDFRTSTCIRETSGTCPTA